MTVKIEWFSGQGAGGQHRNKHQNCCRITHVETGLTANGTNSRSREANKQSAMAVLKSRVYVKLHPPTERGLAGTERVRTYHEPDDRVVDHASGKRFSYKDVLVDGNVGPCIKARRLAKRSDEDD